jgi:hypothetical protein
VYPELIHPVVEAPLEVAPHEVADPQEVVDPLEVVDHLEGVPHEVEVDTMGVAPLEVATPVEAQERDQQVASHLIRVLPLVDP